MNLAGRTAVVVGGASGIGRATVESLRNHGANVLSSDLAGTDADIVCDLRDETTIVALMSEIQRRLGRLDILVNCAAAFVMKAGHQAMVSDWDTVLDVNLVGAATLLRHAVPILAQADRAAVVLVASISGIKADSGYATYSCSKAALLMLARSLAIDLGRYGIRVNTVSPGPVDTPALERELQRCGLSREVFEKNLVERQCLPMLALPEDIAQSILFLASDSARMITGANLVVDGGWLV